MCASGPLAHIYMIPLAHIYMIPLAHIYMIPLPHIYMIQLAHIYMIPLAHKYMIPLAHIYIIPPAHIYMIPLAHIYIIPLAHIYMTAHFIPTNTHIHDRSLSWHRNFNKTWWGLTSSLALTFPVSEFVRYLKCFPQMIESRSHKRVASIAANTYFRIVI
jgi:hypothetical protein